MITVFFDLETGGVQDQHPDIQLAAVAVDEATWQELDSYEAKIQFNEKDADPEALRLNHYDRAIWDRQAKPERVVVREFSTWLERFKSLQLVSKRTGRPYNVAKLSGHNAATFDGPRLRRMFERNEAFCPWDPRVRCTLQRSLAWFDEHGVNPPSYKLTELCKFFGLPVSEDAHDALADVRMTATLARRLREVEPHAPTVKQESAA